MSRGFLDEDEPRKSDLVDITCQIKIDQPERKAILVSCNGKEVWLPRSQIEYERITGVKIRVTLPEWLAKEKDLV